MIVLNSLTDKAFQQCYKMGVIIPILSVNNKKINDCFQLADFEWIDPKGR